MGLKWVNLYNCSYSGFLSALTCYEIIFILLYLKLWSNNEKNVLIEFRQCWKNDSLKRNFASHFWTIKLLHFMQHLFIQLYFRWWTKEYFPVLFWWLQQTMWQEKDVTKYEFRSYTNRKWLKIQKIGMRRMPFRKDQMLKGDRTVRLAADPAIRDGSNVILTRQRFENWNGENDFLHLTLHHLFLRQLGKKRVEKSFCY